MKLRPQLRSGLAQILRSLVAGAVAVRWLSLAPLPAAAADAVFPIGSRLGFVPPTELKPATTFPGFEDEQNGVFVRLVALPGKAFAEIEKTMTNDALKKQGMTVEKRESLPLGSGNAILAIVRQDTAAGRIRKWLLIAPIDDLTALVSLEMPATAPAPYTDAVIRAALTSLTTRPHVPAEEQLTMVPFKVGDTRRACGSSAWCRAWRCNSPTAPRIRWRRPSRPHLVIAAAPGGPAETPRPRSVRPQRDERPAAVQGIAHHQRGADAHWRPART